MTYFWRTPWRFDVDRIQTELTQLCTTLFNGKDVDRFALVHLSETDQDPIADANSKNRWPAGTKMSDFRYFNRSAMGGYIHRFYETLREADPRVARLRVAWIRPRRCYSFHNDEEVRYHLAVTTNLSCLFVVSETPRNELNQPVYPPGQFELPELHVFRIPRDSHVYALDTNHVHTAINAGDTDRIHLLIETSNPLNERPVRVSG